MATMFYGFNIGTNGTDLFTRVALVLYSSDVKVLGDLNHYTSYDMFVSDTLTLESYHSKTDGIVDIYT